MAAVKNEGLALEFADKLLKKDKEIVIEAVRNDGFAIANADYKYLDDKEVAIEAIKNNTGAFLLLNKKLTEDNDIINLAGLGNKSSKTKNNFKDLKKHLLKGEKWNL